MWEQVATTDLNQDAKEGRAEELEPVSFCTQLPQEAARPLPPLCQ